MTDRWIDKQTERYVESSSLDSIFSPCQMGALCISFSSSYTHCFYPKFGQFVFLGQIVRSLRAEEDQGASPCPLSPSSIFSPLNQSATMGSDRAKGNNQGGVTGRVTPKRRGGTGAPANRHPLSSHSAVLLACPLLCYAQSLREWGHFSSLLSHKLSLCLVLRPFPHCLLVFDFLFRYLCLCLSSLCFS